MNQKVSDQVNEKSFSQSSVNRPFVPVNAQDIFPWFLSPTSQHPDYIEELHDQPPINPQFLRLVGSTAAKRAFESKPREVVELSPQGASFLMDAMDVLSRVKANLIKTGEVEATPTISNKPYPEFIQMLTDEITNEAELKYIMHSIDRMIETIERTRQEVWLYKQAEFPVPEDQGVPKHKTTKSLRIFY